MNKTSNRALIWDISDSVFVINIDQVFLLPGKLSKIDLFSDQEQWNTMSPLFNDVHVMVFLGIAFILTFLRGYRCGQTTSSTRKQIFCSEIGLFFFLICKKFRSGVRGYLASPSSSASPPSASTSSSAVSPSSHTSWVRTEIK